MSEAAADPPEITADLFAEVLERDLANIVRKASSGQPLTKREREMIEDERKRLASPQKSREPDFQLEGAGERSPLEGLTQEKLAAAWGYSVRQIKNWIQEGREKTDPAPLTKPAEMPAWFERVFAPRKCPDRLRLAVQALLNASASNATGSRGASPAPPAERITIDDSEKGLLAMLGRLRESEALLHAKYLAAVDVDEHKASFLFSEWGKIVERLRALEKSAPKSLEELGIYVRRDEVIRELAPLHVAILKSFRQAIRQGRLRLRATTDAAEWNAVADSLVDEAATMLCESSFATPLDLE
jgi:hypothetical protein